MMSRPWLARWPAILFLVSMAALMSTRVHTRERASEPRHPGAEDRLRKDIDYLASDKLQGRGVRTKGINLAAKHIANEFKKAGLKPAAGNDGYFQKFNLNLGSAELENTPTLRLRGPNGQDLKLDVDEQFQVLGLSEAGKISAPVVFIGYGITHDKRGYDDYKPVDVKGKVVIVIRGTPRADNPDDFFKDGSKERHAALKTKMDNAELHKAAAVIFVNDQTMAADEDTLMTFDYTSRTRQASALPAVHVRRDVIDKVLQAQAKTSLTALEKEIDRTLKPCSKALEGWTADIEIQIHREEVQVKNVIGVLEGAGPHANETIVVGAHYDHLGMNGQEGDDDPPTIYHGADDNGSGTTVMMELARRFGAIKNRQGRRLVFMAFTAEESGLLGSLHYCEHPLFSLDSTVTMVNIDMVGRLPADDENGKGALGVYGVGTSEGFENIIDKLNRKHNFQLQKHHSTKIGGGDSDHSSFYAKKIPVIFFFTGTHPDYHQPSDTSDKINVPGMNMIADFVEDLVLRINKLPERPGYVDVSGAGDSGASSGPPRMGIKPNKEKSDKDGVVIEEVDENGPAGQAGLQKGDRIVAMGGKPVNNLQNYLLLLRKFKKGDTITVDYIRDGKKQSVEVDLE